MLLRYPKPLLNRGHICAGSKLIEQTRAVRAVLLGASLDFQSTIMFEDEGVIVLNKPPGIYSAAAESDENNAVCMLGHAANYLQRNDIYQVHRLDRDTSGILILAKNRASNQSIVHCFNNNSTRKSYFCIIDTTFGAWNTLSAMCMEKGLHVSTGHGRSSGAFSIFHSSDIGRELPNRKGSKVKLAESIFKLIYLDRSLKRALVKVTLMTGRTHQIRTHLAFLGFPILGDARYSLQRGIDHKNQCSRFPYHFLRAVSLEIPPLSMTFTLDLPIEWRQVLQWEET